MNTPYSPAGMNAVADRPELSDTPLSDPPLGDQMKDAVTAHAQALQSGVNTVLDQAPDAITGAVNDAEALLRSGYERMRDAGAQASDRAATYVKDEPVKALLMAAAAGALGAVVLGWVTRPRHGH